MDISNKILSDIVVYTKYAKYNETLKRRETFEEICTRNMEMHIKKYPDLKDEITYVYTNYVIPKKILPSMRSLQFSGKAIEVNHSRIYNCSYLPAKDIKFFNELMFLLLGGSGVGYSVQTHHVNQIPPIIVPKKHRKFVVEDSIAGWADAIKVLFKSYTQGVTKPIYDFSQVRPKGALLITAGGKAPGPGPLKTCLIKIENILENANNRKLTTLEVHEIACHIADAVLAGGIRRAAMISFFDHNDIDMLTCKSGAWWDNHPEFARANNSVVLERGKISYAEFNSIWERVKLSGAGEPGFMWTSDKEVLGNPCFTGETVVATADGRNGVEISKLAEEGKQFQVYSAEYHNGKWVTQIKNAVAFKTGNKKVVEVKLSNGTSVRCTEDHKFALTNGEYCEAKDLKGKKLVKPEIEDYSKFNDVVDKCYVVDVYCEDVLFTGNFEDVYDLTVEDNHNFYILNKGDLNFYNSSGILVHNCNEISLRPYGFCNLCEINAASVESEEDFFNRCRAASFVGTLQAGYTDFYYLREEWKETAEEEALLGVSLTGIASNALKDCDKKRGAELVVEENKRVAKLIGIKPAKRTTCIKPAGTTSLTLGCSSGIHAYHAPYYIRRMRIGKDEAIYKYLKAELPDLIEDDYFKPNMISVLSIPQKSPNNAIFRTEKAIDLLERSKDYYDTWILGGHVEGANSHNISITVSIKEDEWDIVGEWMWVNKNHYNGISVLPFDGGTYKQPPFEDCDEHTYLTLFDKLKNIDLRKINEEEDNTDLAGELACSGGSCEIK